MNFSFVFVYLALGSTFRVCVNASSSNRSRIYKGHDAIPGQIPYAVRIELTLTNGEQNDCSGALIGSTWVLSSAHCFINVASFIVYLGSTCREDAKVAYQLTLHDTIEHYAWDPVTGENDIILIEIPETESCGNITPVPLPQSGVAVSTYASQQAILSGWGNMGDSGPAAECLQWGSVTIIANEECGYFFESIGASDICTSSIEHTAHCPGDSGGPLVLESTGELIGLVDYMSSKGCEDGNPSVFIRITSYLDWIKGYTEIKI